jgi:hypothetical protein
MTGTSENPRDGYFTDEEMANARGVTRRTQRAERARGEGPPHVKDGKKVLYPVEGYRAYLKAIERQPVRSPKPARRHSLDQRQAV